MTGAHTPGPWSVRETSDGNCLSIDAWGGGTPSDWLTHSQCWFNRNRTREETEANARLIAAAPDMLAALQRLAALTPSVASASTADDLHLTVKAIAESAIERACPTPLPSGSIER